MKRNKTLLWGLLLALWLNACTTTPPEEVEKEQPQVTLSPASLTLLPGETSDPVRLGASGFGGEVTFSVSDVDAFDATLSPATLTDPATLTVAPQDGAAEGTYTFVVTGESGGQRDTTTLIVALEYDPQPQLGVPGEVTTTRAQSPNLFYVKNTGSSRSTLEWRVSSDSDRVTVSPEEGVIEGNGRTGVSVTVDGSDLEEGKPLSAVLSFTSNAGDAAVEVVYRKTAETVGLERCGTYPSSFVGANSAAGRAANAASRARPAALPRTPYVPGELLVRYREPVGLGAEGSGVRELEARQGASAAVRRDFGLVLKEAGGLHTPDLVKVERAEALGAGTPEADTLDMEALAARLEKDPRVAYAEPNYYLTLLETRPDDERLPEQWNLLDFGLPQAWDVATGKGGNEVVVAIIDSGVDMNHEDLAPKMLPGCDFYDEDNDPNPGPRNGFAEHGTHVAGIAAAAGDNGLGIAGVAYGPGVKILPVKVFDESGQVATIAELIDAVRWAAGLPVEGVAPNPNKADVINMSLGTGQRQIESVNEAMKQAAAAGVVLFASSGNAGGSGGSAQGGAIMSPANAPSVIAVGAVNGDYRRATFSDYATSGPTVDLMAPGGTKTLTLGCRDILSTFTSDSFGQSEYGCLMGTSMASPFAAGVAALVLSQNPNLSPQQVKAKLTGSAQFSPFMNRAEYGAGVVCADKALGAPTRCGR